MPVNPKLLAAFLVIDLPPDNVALTDPEDGGLYLTDPDTGQILTSDEEED